MKLYSSLYEEKLFIFRILKYSVSYVDYFVTLWVCIITGRTIKTVDEMQRSKLLFILNVV